MIPLNNLAIHDIVNIPQSVDMILTSIRGQKYSCSVPNFDSPSALGKAAVVFPNVSKVLKPLQDGPCLSKV